MPARRLATRFCWDWVVPCALAIFLGPPAFGLTHDEITACALSTYSSKASTFSSNYYLNQYLNGVSPCCPKYEGSLLSWGETYLGIPHRAMWESTHDTQFLELLLNHAEVMYANRGDRVSPPVYDQIRNKQMPAFVSFNLSEGANARQHSWLVHSAYVSHPATFAIATINNNSQLQAQYGARAAAITTDIIQTMDSFDPEFSMISGGRGQYYDPYFQFYAPSTGGVLPYNMQSGAGLAYIGLWKATGDQRFYDRATALAKTLKAELTVVSDRYRWRYGPFDSAGSSSDVSHAGLDVEFAIDAYEAGIVFDDTDIQRLANTFRFIRKPPGFTATVSGSGSGIVDNVRFVSTWLQLARYDAALRQDMFPVFQSYWNTDCCSWPMLGAAHFYESGQYYTAQTEFQDSFDGLQISPRWRRPATQLITNGWVAQTLGSQLVVSDVKTTTNESWVDIVKTRDIDQDDTWEVAFDFSWNSTHGTTDPLQAMQRFAVELHDGAGTLVANVGINDGWHQHHGGRWIQLFGQSISEPFDSIGASGSASIRILSDATLGVSQVFWNDALVLSAPTATDLKQVGMKFGYFRHFSGPQLLSHFGSISVGSLVAGEISSPPGDYDGSGVVDGSDYVVWRKTLGQSGSGLAADGNHNGQIDTGDYDVWRASFGRTAASGATADPLLSSAVPEPPAAALLVMGASLVLRRRVALSIHVRFSAAPGRRRQ